MTIPHKTALYTLSTWPLVLYKSFPLGRVSSYRSIPTPPPPPACSRPAHRPESAVSGTSLVLLVRDRLVAHVPLSGARAAKHAMDRAIVCRCTAAGCLHRSASSHTWSYPSHSVPIRVTLSLSESPASLPYLMRQSPLQHTHTHTHTHTYPSPLCTFSRGHPRVT
jgi:hypothetical protein